MPQSNVIELTLPLPPGPEANALLLAEAIRLGVQIADRAVVADIETNCTRERFSDQGPWWYDTRALLSLDEQPAEFVDMASQALAYAHVRKLVARHPDRPHLVRITAAL